MRILPRPFFKGMLIAIVPVALFFNFKSNPAQFVREKITPQAAMTVSLTEADFLTQVQKDHAVSELEIMGMRSIYEGATAAELVVAREDKVKQDDFPQNTTAVVPLALPNETQFEALFDTFSKEYGVSKNVLKSIAYCESGTRPQASNGPYGGMFQFTQGTWISNRRAMGLEQNPTLRFEASEAIKTAAFKISRDGVSAWPVCGERALAVAEL